ALLYRIRESSRSLVGVRGGEAAPNIAFCCVTRLRRATQQKHEKSSEKDIIFGMARDNLGLRSSEVNEPIAVVAISS
ncbi:MAG TPA: hypothetical protein VFU22_33005, partial [Roseiflexaceae bacterium]|nr:hypothetical protein [Roseiflexaceae bacterium]